MNTTTFPSETEAKPASIPIHGALADWITTLRAGQNDIPIDEEFISWIVTSGVRDGYRRVTRHHRNRYNARRRAAMRKLVLATKAQKRRVRDLTSQTEKARRRFEKMPDLSLWNHWNSWALFKFGLILLAMFSIMLAAGTSAFVLLRISSDFSEFPMVCAAVGAIVVFGVVGVKFGLEQFKSEAGVRRTALTLSGITLVLSLWYCFLLANVTGGFGSQLLTPETMIEDPAVQTNHAALCIQLMWVQMWLEIFAGLTLFSFAQQTHGQHRAKGPEPTPEGVLRKQAWDEAAVEQRMEECKLEDIKACPSALRAAQNEYVEKAAALFLARARAAENQRAGIEAKAGKPVKEKNTTRPLLIDRIIDLFRN